MNFFRNKIINIASNEKIKEGNLKKESRYRKVWRTRWVVLTTTKIYTFERPGIYRNPTETINIKNIRAVKTDVTKKRLCFVSICTNLKYINFNLLLFY